MAFVAGMVVGLIVGLIAWAIQRGRFGLITVGAGMIGGAVGGLVSSGQSPGLATDGLIVATLGSILAIAFIRFAFRGRYRDHETARAVAPVAVQPSPEPRASNVLTFMSYRREEASGHAGRLYDVLLTKFRSDQVFMDIDAIPPGVDFGDHIEAAVARCDVLLALIGPRWSTVTDETGLRRLDDPGDFVRLEIEAALRRNIRVVPVLIQGGRMPRPDDLPEELRPLTRRNSFELSDARFRFDADRLIDILIEMDAAKRPPA